VAQRGLQDTGTRGKTLTPSPGRSLPLRPLHDLSMTSLCGEMVLWAKPFKNASYLPSQAQDILPGFNRASVKMRRPKPQQNHCLKALLIEFSCAGIGVQSDPVVQRAECAKCRAYLI